MIVYEAANLDIIAAAGGPMGSPVETRWRRLYTTERKAKLACEKDYGKPIKWKRRSGGSYSSGDLLHVEYEIRPQAVL